MLHQIIKAVPLVILSSSLDVDAVVEITEGRTVGYFYDTCDDGTGSAEAIFHQLSQFASKAKALPAFLTNFAFIIAQSLMQSRIDPDQNEAKKTTHC